MFNVFMFVLLFSLLFTVAPAPLHLFVCAVQAEAAQDARRKSTAPACSHGVHFGAEQETAT